MTTGAKQKSFTKGAMVFLGTSLAALTLMASTSASAYDYGYGNNSGYPSRLGGYYYSRDTGGFDFLPEYDDVNPEYPSRLGGYLYSRTSGGFDFLPEYDDVNPEYPSRFGGYLYSHGYGYDNKDEDSAYFKRLYK